VTTPERQCGIVVQKRALLPWRNISTSHAADRHEAVPAADYRSAPSACEAGRSRGVLRTSCRAIVGRHAEAAPRSGGRWLHDPKSCDERAVRRVDAMTRERMNVELMADSARDRQDRAADYPSIPEAVFLADACWSWTERPGAIAGDLDVHARPPLLARCRGGARVTELVQRTARISSPKRSWIEGKPMPPRLTARGYRFFERKRSGCEAIPVWRGDIHCRNAGFRRVEIGGKGQGQFGRRQSRKLIDAEMFDKRQHLSPDDTVHGVRRSLEIARDLIWTIGDLITEFGLQGSRIAGKSMRAAARIPRLPPRMDRRRSTRRSWMRCCDARGDFRGMTRNVSQCDARAVVGSRGGRNPRFLARCRRLERVAIRIPSALDEPPPPPPTTPPPQPSPPWIEGEGGVTIAKRKWGARISVKLNGDSRTRRRRLLRIGREVARLPHD